MIVKHANRIIMATDSGHSILCNFHAPLLYSLYINTIDW